MTQIDPTLFDREDLVFVDFEVQCPHPLEPGTVFQIPCRKLDPGEIRVIILALQEKYPSVVDDGRVVSNEESVKLHKVDQELYTEVALMSVQQAGWTRERLAKLPFIVRKEIYNKAMDVGEEETPAADSFPSEDREERPEDSSDVS